MKEASKQVKKTIYPVEDVDCYTCVYVIDIPAKSFLEAAKAAQNIMRNPEFGEFFHRVADIVGHTGKEADFHGPVEVAFIAALENRLSHGVHERFGESL